MQQIPVELQTELLEEVTQSQHLVTITTKSHTYRWTDGQNDVYWNGNWWVSKGIEFDTIGSTISGQLDSLTLEIDNVDQKFSDLVLSEDIRGSQCIIEFVCLDINQKVIGEPVVLFQGFLDKMPMDGVKARVEVFSHMVRWKLMTPRRQHTPSCGWTFKDTIGCHYDGNIFRNPTSDVLAEFTRSHLASNYLNVDDRLEDLCIGGTYTCSSKYGGGEEFGAGAAFDRNPVTYWLSAGAGDPDWIKVQFAIAKIINKYKLTQLSLAYSSYDFIFQGSNDDAVWVDLDSKNGESWNYEGGFRVVDFTNPIAYLYYRFYISRSHPSYQSAIKELELFGPSTQVNDSDYNYISNVVTKADLFGFTPIVVPTDLTITSVVVRVRAKQTDAAARNVGARLRINGVDYDASTISPATSPTNYDFTWALNPHSGVAWVPNDFNTQVDLCVGGTPSADSTTGGYPVTNAFDLTTANWLSDVTFPHWLRYQLLVAKTVKSYSITAPVLEGHEIHAPKDWKLQGSNDLGGAWTDLDTQTGVIFTVGQKKYFSVASPASYLYYQLNMTLSQSGGAYAAVNKFELFEYDVIEAFGYFVPANAGGHEVTVEECYLKVVSDVVSCDLSAERCTLLNNRDNFGGFAFISELQTKEYWWGSKQRLWGGGI